MDLCAEGALLEGSDASSVASASKVDRLDLQVGTVEQLPRFSGTCLGDCVSWKGSAAFCVVAVRRAWMRSVRLGQALGPMPLRPRRRRSEWFLSFSVVCFCSTSPSCSSSRMRTQKLAVRPAMTFAEQCR